MGIYQTLLLLGVILVSAYAKSSTSKATMTTSKPTAPPPKPWIPPRDPKMFKGGETVTVYTSQISRALYLMEDRTSISFRVKACSAAVLEITGLTLSSHEAEFTQVVLGSHHNSKTVIYHGGHIIASVATPEILHCHEFRTFWMRWRPGLLEMGHGPALGRNTIIANYDIMTVGATLAIDLSSEYEDRNVVWEMKENTGDELIVVTSLIYGYEKLWRSVQERNFITFHVAACSDAHIILTSKHGSIMDKVYEVVLGAKDNTEALIRTQANGGEDSVLVSHVEDGLLHCNKTREFWIGWLNHPQGMGTLQVGRGHLFGVDGLLRIADPTQTVNIRHMAISTANGNPGAWSFEDDLGDVTTFSTSCRKNASLEERYQQAWLKSPKKHFMTFFVTACSDAYVHLSSLGEVDEEYGVELMIGVGGKTILGSTAEVGNLAVADTPDILSCDQVRLFWLSWKDGYIRFGRGRLYDTQLVLEAQGPAKHYTAMSFSTLGEEKKGMWRIRESAGESLLFKDKPVAEESFVPSVWRTVTSQKRVSFQTDACTDVTVMLSPTPGIDEETFYYLVKLVMKNASYSTIELCENGGKKCVVLSNDSITDTLTCGSWRDFYITWYEGRIVVGRGTFPTLLSSLLEADSPSVVHHVKAVAMSTSGEKDVSWLFRQDVGDRFIYHTATKLKYDTWIGLLPGMKYIQFEVTACSDAHVRLISGFSEPSSRYVEIIISGWGNKFNVIMDNTGLIGANVTKGYLDCHNARVFWISWSDDGLIQLGGGGPLLDAMVIASWTNPKPFNISAVAISTDKGYDGLWSFAENMGSWTHFPTHVGIVAINMEETWRTVEHTRSIFFKVMAEAEVHVVLSEELGVTTKNALEVALGARNNTISLIRRPNSETNWITAETPKILNKDNFRDFWISWSEGEVQVGRGDIPGQDRFLQYQVIKGLNIRALRFSTTFNTEEGKWELPLWDGLFPITPE